MIGEVDVGGGVLIPTFAIWAAIGLAIGFVLRRALRWAGFYRLVWHPALFDVATSVVLIGATVAAARLLLDR